MKTNHNIPSIVSLQKSYIFLLITLVIVIFTSCEEQVEPTRTFTIAKGEHYSSPRVSETLQSNVLEFDAMFDNTAMYDLGDQALQSNKNKLMGFADCNSMHHENSARFGWQWFNNRLEIFAYTYVNGERQESFIGVVNINEFNHFRLTLENDHYVFQLNSEQSVSMPRGSTCDQGGYYKLWPYFGGSVAAPHDVRITIKSMY